MWAGLATMFAAMSLAGCGGHNGGDSSNVRLVNATVTHASLNLIASSATAVSGVAVNTVSSMSG